MTGCLRASGARIVHVLDPRDALRRPAVTPREANRSGTWRHNHWLTPGGFWRVAIAGRPLV